MSRAITTKLDERAVWRRYQSNFPRHLQAVARHLQTEAMKNLAENCNHSDLRLSFEAFIALIGPNGTRLTDIANAMAVSKQACNQSANAIENAGYIQRISDPSDGRAKLLTLTARGETLRSDGIKVVAAIQTQLTQMSGAQAMATAIAALGKLSSALSILMPGNRGVDNHRAELGGLLPRLSSYIDNRQMALTISKGHPGLKMSYATVLRRIGPSGDRIQHMAASQGVSKQAISAIATDLERLGYVSRRPDRWNAQRVVLQFTDRGRELIADSVACTDEIEAEFEAIVGHSSLRHLRRTFESLYKALQLENDAESDNSSVDIGALSQQLIKQLGQRGAEALAARLLAPGRNRGFSNG